MLIHYDNSPISVEQIQGILQIANEFIIPIWVLSQGKNFGYGGPAPRQSGSLVVSLHRMKRILEVNEKFAYVLVEPGVTFFELYEHLKVRKIPLWVGVPALGWGSVLGNVWYSSSGTWDAIMLTKFAFQDS